MYIPVVYVNFEILILLHLRTFLYTYLYIYKMWKYDEGHLLLKLINKEIRTNPIGLTCVFYR